MKRRLISLIVTICMIVNMLPMVVLGADEQYQIQVDDAIVLNKSLVPATATSPAKIRLEAYVNGTTSVSQQHKPADIVLVLDQSGSMADNVGQSTKLALLKSAAQAFIDEIAGMNNTAGDLYRVAVVGFASESGYGNNTEILTVKNRNSYGVAYNNLTTANYQNALVNCVADSEALNSAVQALAASGATRADLGMEMAAKIFDNQPAGTYDDRSKIVVFITDGEPTTSNRFSSSVANAAVTEAKDMKAEGAYIFSMYIGTPSSNASSFMQAVSSNYPDATRYNDLGTQAADSYYSAHNDASGVESMLKTVVSKISALAALDENAIIKNTISSHFMLAADVETTGLNQIEVYTEDKTATGWSGVEVPYENAQISFIGDNQKQIGVSGFDFAENCITAEPRGNDFYGKKLIIYIPIVEDPSDDTFGGYLTATTTTEIYEDAEALAANEPTATAGQIKTDVTLRYTIEAAERAYHIDGTLLSEPASYTVSFTGTDGIASSVFDEMIPRLPNEYRNLGVYITYKLIDIGTADINSNDRNDDVLVASITVPVADDVDVTDPAKWTWVDGLESFELTIPANEYFAEKVFVVVATLTNARDIATPDLMTVYNYLDLSVVRGDLAHIVYGVIDENGKTSVPAGAPGSLMGNTYTEAVTQAQNSAVMTFTPNKGHKIKEILLLTSQNAPFDTRTLIYSTDPNAAVVKVDLDGDGVADTVTLNADGSWSFGAKNVTSGVAVEVSTEPITHKLTTSADAGSEIIRGFTYNYSEEDKINVPFQALVGGYHITSVEINGTVYDVTTREAAAILTGAYETNLIWGTDGTGDPVVLGGDVRLPATQDNDVKVVSTRTDYIVSIKYFLQNEDGTLTEVTDMAQPPVTLSYGDNILANVILNYQIGDKKIISGAEYELNAWYLGHMGNGFSHALDATATMPASNITLNAVWVKVPTYTVQGSIDQNGVTSVPTGAAGQLSGNVYTEIVTENYDSGVMTFTPNEGYEIVEIYYASSETTQFATKTLIYSADPNATVGKVDLDGDGVEDTVILNVDGSWSFGAKAVDINLLVEVYTEPVDKNLTTDADAGSQISAGKVYPYDPNKTEEVTFSANAGYYMATVEINGTVYDLTNAADRETLADLYNAAFVTAVNGSGETVVVSGSLEVSCSRDNHVAVTSQIRSFKVYIKYFIENEGGTYTEVTDLAQPAVVLSYGDNILANVTLSYQIGNKKIISGAEYELNAWYLNDFVSALDATAIMPASDVTLNAVWVKVPTYTVQGSIDQNGTTSVPAGAAGQLSGNIYTETVTENYDSGVMTFTPNEGYEIQEVYFATSDTAQFVNMTLIYSTDPNAVVGKVDLDGDGVADTITLNADGSWSFGAKNVNTNVLVEVRTEAVDKTLTTEADAGSQISAGKVYPYDPNKTEEVTFSANAGCYVATVEINGTVYDLTNAADRENLANLYKAEFVTVVNGSGETVVVSGSVEVSCSRDNHVAVISQIRSFKVYIKYFIKNADGTYTEVTALEQAPVVVQIGATVADKVTFDYAAGATVTVGETEYTLDGWFTDDAANGFVEAFSQTLTMPESDITISAVMTAVPAEDIPPKTGVTLALPMAALAMASIGGVLTLLGKKKFLGEDEE